MLEFNDSIPILNKGNVHILHSESQCKSTKVLEFIDSVPILNKGNVHILHS